MYPTDAQVEAFTAAFSALANVSGLSPASVEKLSAAAENGWCSTGNRGAIVQVYETAAFGRFTPEAMAKVGTILKGVAALPNWQTDTVRTQRALTERLALIAKAR